MSGLKSDDQRWQALADLEALGVPLEGDDAAFFSEYSAAHPECAAESQAWDDLLGGLRGAAGGSSDDDSLSGEDDQALVASLLQTYRSSQTSDADDGDSDSGSSSAVTDPTDELLASPTSQATVHALPMRPRWPLITVGALAAAAALAVVLLPEEPTTSPAAVPAPARQAQATLPQEPAPSDTSPLTEPQPARIADSALIALSSPGGLRIDDKPATTGDRVRDGARLSAEVETCIVFDAPFASVCLRPGTTATLQTTHDGDRLFELERGALVATLDKIPEGQAFKVIADGYQARAVGTVFSVQIAGGEANLGVFEGTVELQSADSTGAARRLTELEHTRFSPAAEITTLPAELRVWSRDRTALAELWRGLDSPSQLHLGESPAALSIDGRALAELPHDLPAGLDMLVSEGPHRLEVHGRSGARTHDLSASPGAPITLTPSELEPPHVASRVKPRPITSAVAGPSIAELRTQASDARATRSWRDAQAAYEELIERHPAAPEALNARVQLGDILRRRLGQPAKALVHFDAYIARGGPLAAEARFGKVLALQQLGRRSDEAAAIRDFLDHHPKHIEAEKLRARARELASP